MKQSKKITQLMVPPKILVVEDESALHEIITECLQELKADFVFANDGQEGLDAIKRESPDVVITDISMPKKSGLEMLKDIKTDGYQYPIVMLSAFGDSKNTIEALRYGAYDFLTKPFEFDHLLKVVQEALQYSRDLKQQQADFDSLLSTLKSGESAFDKIAALEKERIQSSFRRKSKRSA